MAKNVTNAQIADAIRGLGINLPPNIDLTGAQNSEWKRKLTELVQPLLPAGQYAEDIFNRGKDTARKLLDISPNASALDKLGQTLTAYGLSGDQYTAVINEATRIRKSTPGIYQGNIPYNEQDVAQAVSNVLGTTPMAQAAIRAAGLNPPPPAQGSPGAAVTPPPAQMPTTPAPGGVTMGTTRSRATPGIAAPTPTPTGMSGTAAPPAGAAPTGGAGGGGGPNNTPTIDNPANWDDEHVRTWLKQNLGNDAWFIDIPDVWTAMKDAVKGGKGVTGADAAFKATPFYLQSSSSARLWYQKEREDPASAGSDVAKQTQAISKMALDAGITLDPTRAQQMAQSYLRYGWSQADLQQAIGAEWHYDPSTKNQAAAVTQMKTQAQDWLVPLSDQAIQTWGQGLISGTVTQDQYTQYLRDNAKSLMPQLSTLIDQHAGDPKFTVSTFADPYKQHAANLLGIQPDQINLNDSKWRQALDTQDPKTGERRIMTLGEWESKIKTDKSFGYDNTANGIKDGLALADALKTSMGF